MFSLVAKVPTNTTQSPDRTASSIFLSIFFVFVFFDTSNVAPALSSEPNFHVIAVNRYGVEVKTPATWLPVVR